jgi:hypothetical protein
LEQKAKGALERQKITDEAEAEKARKQLLELQANSAAVESTGQAKAEAQSRAEAAKIEGEAAVEQARLKSQATKIEAVSPQHKMVVSLREHSSVFCSEVFLYRDTFVYSNSYRTERVIMQVCLPTEDHWCCCNVFDTQVKAKCMTNFFVDVHHCRSQIWSD